MLLEFRVRNFLSIRDELAFTFAASRDRTRQELATAATGLRSAPRMLLSSVILGPSGSGKSVFLAALDFMRSAVAGSGTLVVPGGQAATGETAFEAAFIAGGVRWQYGFALEAGRVAEEHLLVYRAFKPQQWFWREGGHYTFSASFKGNRQKWAQVAGANELFLPAAVRCGAGQAAPAVQWFREGLRVVQPGQDSAFQLPSDARRLRNAARILAACGYPVAGLSTLDKAVVVRHADGSQMPLSQEPAGLRKALAWADPVAESLTHGGCVAVDDLTDHQHTLVVRTVIGFFHDPDVNRGSGQLLAVAGDASLLAAPDLLRRDQIWLADRTDRGCELVSLVEYSPRKQDALEERYLAGNYGALPALTELEPLD